MWGVELLKRVGCIALMLPAVCCPNAGVQLAASVLIVIYGVVCIVYDVINHGDGA